MIHPCLKHDDHLWVFLQIREGNWGFGLVVLERVNYCLLISFFFRIIIHPEVAYALTIANGVIA